MKKKDPDFNITTDSNNTVETNSFLQSLVENFRQGAYCILEALRLVKAKDKNEELDLMLNDEEHSDEYKAKPDLHYLR